MPQQDFDIEAFITKFIQEDYQGKTLLDTKYSLERKGVYDYGTEDDYDVDDDDYLTEISPAVILASEYKTLEEAQSDLEALIEEGIYERNDLFISKQCLFSYTVEKWLPVHVNTELPVNENGVVNFS